MKTVLHLLGNRRNIGGILSLVNELSNQPCGLFIHKTLVNRSFPLQGERYIKIPYILDDGASHFRLFAGALLSVAPTYKIIKKLHRNDHLVLHSHTRGGMILGMALNLCFAFPLIITHHTYARKKWLYKLLQKRKSVHYVCLSEHMTKYYKYRESTRISCISECYAEKYRTLSRKRLSPSDNSRVSFVGLGSIDHRKGWDIVVEAVSCLPKELREKIEIDLYGSVLDTTYLKSLTARVKSSNLEGVIRVHNPTSEVEQVLLKADYMLSPSRVEPYSISALEALASGLPVISSDCGGFPDFVKSGQNGFTFETDTPGSLTAVLKKVIREDIALLSPLEISQSVSVQSATSVSEKYHRLYDECARPIK